MLNGNYVMRGNYDVKQCICVSSTHVCFNLLYWAFYEYKGIWEVRFTFKRTSSWTETLGVKLGNKR